MAFLDSSASTMDLEIKAGEIIAGKEHNLGAKAVTAGLCRDITPSEFYTYLGYLVDRERIDVVLKLINQLTTERTLYYRKGTEDLKTFLKENQHKSLLLRMLLNHIHYRENALSVTTSVRFTYKEFITGEQFRVDGTTGVFPRTIVHYLKNEPLTDVEPAFFHDLEEAIQLAYGADEDQGRLAKYKAIFRAILPELILIVTSERESSKRLDEALSFITGFKRLSNNIFDVRSADPVLDNDFYTQFVTDFLAELTPAQLLTLSKIAIKYILCAIDGNPSFDALSNTEGQAAKRLRSILCKTPAFKIAHEAYQVDAQIRISTPIHIREFLKLNDPTYFETRRFLEADD